MHYSLYHSRGATTDDSQSYGLQSKILSTDDTYTILKQLHYQVLLVIDMYIIEKKTS